MQAKKGLNFNVFVSPTFVCDIQCSFSGAQVGKKTSKGTSLVSLLDAAQSNAREQQDLFIQTDPRYVSKIEYPTAEETKTLLLLAKRDSLVSQTLLRLTSYDENDNLIEEETGQDVLRGDHVPMMSFDDLGQVYTNLSRKKILSKVQCPNIHFHAHSDGSTTIHRHKSCKGSNATVVGDTNQERKSSQDSVDMANLLKQMSLRNLQTRDEDDEPESIFLQQRNSSLASERLFGRSDSSKDLTRQASSQLSGFSQHVENERYKGTLGRLNQARARMAFLHCKDDEDEADEGSDGTHYASLNRVTEKEPPLHQACQCDEQVGSAEGGVKFNPFYGHPQEQDRQQQPPPPPPAASALCGVLLDAIVHSSNVAATHAEDSQCLQCREFVLGFRDGLNKVIGGGSRDHQHRHPHPKAFSSSRQTSSIDLETGMDGVPLPPQRHFMGFHGLEPYQMGGHSDETSVGETRVRLMAYVAVVVLALLFLVIVVIFLTLFFTQHPSMADN